MSDPGGITVGKLDAARRLRGSVVLAVVAAVAAMALGAVNARAASERRAVIGGSAGSVVTDGYDNERSGYNPNETGLTNANASNLQLLWKDSLLGSMNAQPVEANGVDIDGVSTNVVYEGTQSGFFYAINAANGAVIWRKYLGAEPYACTGQPTELAGVAGAGAISFTGPGTGVVYVEGLGTAHALDLATGSEAPGWPIPDVLNQQDDVPYGGVTLQGNLLYTTSASQCDQVPNHNGIVAINTTTASVQSAFFPSGLRDGGGIWGPGGVSVDPATGHVFAATANAEGPVQNWGFSDAMIEMTPTLSVVGSNSPPPVLVDDDFGSTPILFQPSGCPYLLAAGKMKSGELYISAEGQMDQILQTVHVASQADWEFNGIPAWDPQTQMLYIGNSSDSTGYTHGMVALKAAGGCTLTPAWQTTVGPNLTSVSPPTAAGGVVYYGDGVGNTEHAFDAATGSQLWNSGSTIQGGVYATPMVSSGVLFVPSWDQHLYAFAPPAVVAAARQTTLTERRAAARHRAAARKKRHAHRKRKRRHAHHKKVRRGAAHKHVNLRNALLRFFVSLEKSGR